MLSNDKTDWAALKFSCSILLVSVGLLPSQREKEDKKRQHHMCFSQTEDFIARLNAATQYHTQKDTNTKSAKSFPHENRTQRFYNTKIDWSSTLKPLFCLVLFSVGLRHKHMGTVLWLNGIRQ